MSDVKFNRHTLKPIPVGSVPNGKDVLTQLKINTLLGFPFAGFLVMNTEYFFAEGIPTCAATTIPNNRVYINPVFFFKVLKNDKQRTFVLCHETLHIYLDHIGRAIERCYNMRLWNCAADYYINGLLNDPAFDRMEMPSFGLWRKDFVGLWADEIYHRLLDEHNGDANAAADACGAGELDGDGDGEFSQPRPFDEIGEEVGSKESRLKNDRAVNAALAEQKKSSKKIGTNAADILSRIEDAMKPVIPWQAILHEYITRQSKIQYTYNRLSRRSGRDVVFPSLTGDHIELAFGVDTSGSMSTEELHQALAELYSICTEFESWRVTLLTCDTKAHVLGEYSSEDGDTFDIITREWIGGGGTDMFQLVTGAEELDEAPSALVIITDGYIPTEEFESTVSVTPTILVVTKGGNRDLSLKHYPVIFMDDVVD